MQVFAELQELLNGSAEPEGFTAETFIDGAKVAVSGLPEDSTLNITEADGQHKALADDTIAAALEGEKASELFSWDISVQSGENLNWQPDGIVRMEMDIPDAQFGMYTRVYVVHLDDNGVATTIEADVTDDGKIVFVSDGFSTYYGFTVDFAYHGVTYSIAGMSLILLSELFENLNMSLDVQDVADVTFSDETLVEVKKQSDGNWLLTSLKAFTTTEKLSVTMNGGQVYDITVTDAAYADPDDDPNYVPPTVTARDANGNIKATYNSGSTGRDTITWYAMNDNSNGKVHANSDGLSTDYKIVIDGTNAKGDYPFYVKLQSPQRSGSTTSNPKYIKCTVEGWEDTLWINMYQLEIRGGAHVIVDVGAQFDSSIKQIYLRPSTNDTQSLFNVVNGTLEFTGDADRVIVISGKNNEYYKENPLIMISNGADAFFAQHISFRQSMGRAFLIRANELQNFELVDCEFQSSVGVGKNHLNGESELGGDGGAIRIDETSTADATGNRVDIYNFKLTRCQFKGTTSNDDGGAIYTEGRIYNAVISGCLFNNCTAQQITSDGSEAYAYGGAMAITGYMGKLKIKDTTFSGCKSYGRGGAIYFSMHQNANKNWSRMNEITFQKCSFKNCVSRRSHGGAISTESQIHTLQILGCSFENCRANINGGAVSLGFVELGAKFGEASGSSWQEFFATADGNEDPQYGIRNASSYKWPVDNMYRTTHKKFLVDSYTDPDGVVTRSTFTDCVGQSGGGIEFARHSYTDDADVKNADFIRCRSVANGNAIYTSETVVKYLDVVNVTAKYCTSMKGEPLTVAGTPIYYCKEKYYILNANGVYKEVTISGNTYTQTGINGSTSEVYYRACQKDAEGFYIEAAYTLDTNGKINYTSDTAIYIDIGDAGGTIRSTGKTSCVLTVDNCVLEENSSLQSGGGLYWNANDERNVLPQCSAVIKNSTVCGNYAVRDGGGIFCEAMLTVENCQVYGNSADRYGGGIGQQVYSNETRMMKNNEQTRLLLTGGTAVYDNYAANCGGGISVRANPTSSICNLDADGNMLDPTHADFVSHSIVFSLDSSSVYNNTAKSDGGGIFYATVTDSTGYKHDPNISNEQSIVINNAEVDSYTKSFSVSNGNIYGNQSGVQKNWNSDGTVTTTIKTGNGGGICMKSSANTQLSISSGSVYQNTANCGNGGGIFLTGQDALCTVTGGTVGGSEANKNVATPYVADGKTNRGRGGGIAIFNGSRIEMTGGTITYNEAYIGGGIAVCKNSSMSSDKAADDTAALVANNKATVSGGGIAIFENSRIEMSGGMISNNNAGTAGGGIAVHENSSMYLSGGTVDTNLAGIGGGISVNNCAGDSASEDVSKQYGMYIDGGYVTNNIVNYIAYGGNTVGYGGGICLAMNATMRIDGGEITDNKAIHKGDATYPAGYYQDLEGGGLAVCQNSELTVYGGNIARNNAYNGGGIAIRGASTVQLLPATDSDNNQTATNYGLIDANTATHWGGGVYMADLVLAEGETFTENTDVNYIYIESGTISNNASTLQHGGGVYVGSYGKFWIKDGQIHENSANHFGGGLFATNANVTFSGGYVHDNDAVSGGGLYLCEGTVATVNSGEIYSNIANEEAKTATDDPDTTVFGRGGGAFIRNASLELKGGIVYSNNGKYGAGLAAADSATVLVDGGIVRNNGNYAEDDIINTAEGGGIHANSGAVVTVQNGSVESNVALNGAGIFATASSVDGSEIYVSGGTLKLNTAHGDGAAVYATGYDGTADGKSNQSAYVEIDGGVINDNTAYSNGGGLYVTFEASAKIEGGKISSNDAVCGAGAMAAGSSLLTITNGTIDVNIAEDQGGGVSCIDLATLTVTGGIIEKNHANLGGGVAANDSSTVYLYDGTIQSNTATRNGGGVYVGSFTETDAYPTVYIKPAQGSAAAPVITQNTACNGGGVYVAAQGELYIENAFITYNNANVSAGAALPDTCKGQEDSLCGVGGGICVVGRASTSDATYGPAYFELSGNNMAIYGNEAEYSADDVFSNGLNTQLKVPLVSDMNLDGYDFKAEGWFEDYNNNDTQYHLGLNMANTAAGEHTAIRYRESLSSQRLHIVPVYVTGSDGSQTAGNRAYVNKSNAYVAMTLGIPAAVNDTVVIDYDLSVNVNLYENDLLVTTDDFENTGKLGMARPSTITVKDDVYYSAALMGEFPAKVLNHGVNQLKYGKATLGDDGVLKYALTDKSMTSDEVFYYVVRHNEYYYYASVTVIPATSIYYEDNCGFVTYVGEWVNTDGSDSGTNLDDYTQNQDRPGQSILEDLDADKVYGYDDSLDSMASYSMGSAHKVRVSEGKDATATFTFTGTGFDVISLCNKDTGIVMVTIYPQDDPATKDVDESETPLETMMVDTYYETGTDIYQVPIIKRSGLEYGTWTVELYVAWAWWVEESRPNYEWCDFYLDAIRIYDPANNGADSETIRDAYLADNECWPAYREIRDMLISADAFSNILDTNINGIIFIDSNGSLGSGNNSGETPEEGNLAGKKPEIVDYANYGPNNEVYLAPGQGIAFRLDTGAAQLPEGVQIASVHLALKSLSGSCSYKLYDASAISFADAPVRTLNTSSDMFYDITGMDGHDVVIFCDADSASILSITNLKITYTADPYASSGSGELGGGSESSIPGSGQIFVMNAEVADAALHSLYAEEVSVPTLTAKYPTLSFEGEIRYNVYFAAENLNGLSAENMGLAVFAEENTAGTVETATDVIWGAVESGELYMISTNGIAAKNMGDRLYFKLVARLSDGSYTYSVMHSYSTMDYARSILASSDNEAQKALVVAMLNYGAQAQRYFGYHVDDLMNAFLSEEDLAVLDHFRAEDLDSVGTVDEAKVGSFAATDSFTSKHPTVSFEGAFGINYHFASLYEAESAVTFYYWNEETYNSAEKLTVDNADGVIEMTAADGVYTASSGQIVAKELDNTVYVAAVYTAAGQTHCSGVLAYSVAAYCCQLAKDPASNMNALAHAAAVYGCAAKAYFAA